MILVTVGTNEARFDRLLSALDARSGDEPLFVQHGPSPVRPRGATCVEFLPFDELAALIRDARVVVTHAGVGSTIAALVNGKRPIVVPRLARFREAVDDHQVPFGRRLHEAGLVQFVEDPAGLPDAIAGHSASDAVQLQPNSQLVDELRDYVRSHVRPGSAAEHAAKG
jgi:UDP-N-acetylglucosamine transferase subunit ALG13